MVKLKNYLKSKTQLAFNKLGVEIRLLSNLEADLKVLYSLALSDDTDKLLQFIEKLIKSYPFHPQPYLELCKFYLFSGDVKLFDELSKYDNVKRDWLNSANLSQFEYEFVDTSCVVGSLGNHYALEGLIEAGKYGLRKNTNLVLLLPEKSRVRNETLFEYFKPYLTVHRDIELIGALKKLESLLSLPLGVCLPINSGCEFFDIAANLIEQEKNKIESNGHLFNLNDKDIEKGVKELKAFGIPEDAWFVTLHVREPGYRGESANTTKEKFRNANPLDYVDACKEITNAGGWVFRMGDSTMTKFPVMKNVIDYAHHGRRSEFMDVFLAAKCRFCIGTASGYFRIPRLFGKPVMLTNSASSVAYYSLRKSDIYIPRMLRVESTARKLSFRELLSPPLSIYGSDKLFFKNDLIWEQNTKEELTNATLEMLAFTAGNTYDSCSISIEQTKFKEIAREVGHHYRGRSLMSYANISQYTIMQNQDLLN